MSLVGQILQDSPAGYWPLDETSGTTATDLSGNDRNGTHVNTPTLAVAGPAGLKAAEYVAAGSERTDVTTTGLFRLATLTIEFWFYLVGGTGTARMGTSCSGGTGSGNISISTSLLGFTYTATDPAADRQYSMDSASFSADTWHHAVIAITKTTAITTNQWYVNGEAVAGSWNGSITDGAQNTSFNTGSTDTIGACFINSYQYTNSRLAHVAIFNSILAADRIKAHYEAGIRSGVVF